MTDQQFTPDDLALIVELADEAIAGARDMDEALHNAAHGAALAAAFSNFELTAAGKAEAASAASNEAVNLGRGVVERVKAIYASAARQLRINFPPSAQRGVH